MFDALHNIDIIIIVAYLVFTFLIGIYFSRRASQNMDEFFVAGRSLPWWIVGTSMVATTFAADTPLAVSGLVAKQGIWWNWTWWNWGIGGIFTVFLFAKLWHRSGITTDAELIELRYDGRPAAGLRLYRALWFGLFQNLLIIAWVMKAMAKVTLTIMGWDVDTEIMGMPAENFVVIVLFMLTVFYTVMSGLWGVVTTDVVQFVIAMGGSIYLAVTAYTRLGGIDSIKEKLISHEFDVDTILQIIPSMTPVTEFSPFTKFLTLVLVVWIVMYNVDGGGYLAQRLFAAKNERHSMFAYLWYNIAMVCLRPWPWIVVGLCGMAFFGKVSDAETYYPLMMKEMLPVGLFGIMIASFLAAFMSTIDTQLNWGASILVNDCYKRFFRKDAPQKEYVLAARIFIMILAALGAMVSFYIKDISQAWFLIFSVTAGIGSVYIFRWYWWRINAWSEISAFASALIMTFVLRGVPFIKTMDSLKDSGLAKGLAGLYPEQLWFTFPYSILFSMFFVIPIWITITMLTRPVSREHLVKFYKKVYPGGPGWADFKKEAPGKESEGLNARTFVNIALGVTVSNCFLIGTGKMILGSPLVGIVLLIGAFISGTLLYRNIK
ncbi:MAG: Na+:solute symporter [Fibrobacteria bacterium]|nr:Na+:solute symporter [Fibrobacteria bacterium]